MLILSPTLFAVAALRAAIPVAAIAPAPAPPATAPAAARSGTIERARYLMGTTCTIRAELPEGAAAGAVEAAFAEIARWESILSDYDPESELSRLDAADPGMPVACSQDLLSWLAGSLRLSAETAGAFDVTAGALVDAYALRRGGRWPSAEDLAEARRATGSSKVALDPARGTVNLTVAGMRLDPGGNGKGIALDAAGDILRARGARWAVLDFGGQILVVGSGPDGCGVPVEVAAFGRDSVEGIVIHLRDASVATSSNDERGLVVDGRPLGHILDPRTGLPATRVRRVTVVAPTAALADALSTAFFVMGPDEAAPVASRLGADALFTSRDGGNPALIPTPGFGRLRRRNCDADRPASAIPGNRGH